NNLSQLNSLFLNNNQLGNEDMEVIGGLTNLTTLFLSQNHITDIRPLASLSKMDSADFANQVIKKPARNFSKTLSVPNNITSIDGTLVTPKTISNNGTYDAPNVNWSSPSYLPEVRYTFKQDVVVGSTTSSYTGIIIQPLNEPVDYNVTFNIDGNTSEVKTVTEEDLIPEPANPTKQGYTFDGWYDAETGGNKWDFKTMKMPANDVTLYAHFTINNYQANFDIDGSVTNETITYDTLLNEPTAPTKQGFLFDGWYDAEVGGTKWDFNTMKMPANDINLYAHFSKETPLIPSPSDESDSKPTNGSITINEPSATSMPAQNNNITVTAGENTPELTTAKLPKTGDNNPWQTLFAGILLSSSAFYIWRKKA
ncbi:TPA: LPXTG cell wall anchor domain-containing protein, partial [Listeria monocytogenes]|nr:LPXTG cell wall anchor domain-containing protein [Listeria monocytogenes]